MPIPRNIAEQLHEIRAYMVKGYDALVDPDLKTDKKLEKVKATIEQANLKPRDLLEIAQQAVQEDMYGLVKWLVESKGVNVNTSLRNERSLLMAADSAEMVNLLLDRGAKIEATDHYGQTALIHILNRLETEVKYADKLIKENVQGPHNANFIAQLKTTIEVLIERGSPVERAFSNNMDGYKGDTRTPLGITAQAGFFDIMQLLIQKGANPETQMVAIRGTEEKTELTNARDNLAKTPEEREQFRNEIKTHITSAWIKQPGMSSTVMAESKAVVEGNKDLSRMIADYAGTGIGMFKPAETKEIKTGANVKEKIKQFEENQAIKKSGPK